MLFSRNGLTNILLVVCVILCLYNVLDLLKYSCNHSYALNPSNVRPQEENNITAFNNLNIIVRRPEAIVPNIIHYLRMGESSFSMLEATCILSAFRNHKPDRIIFHTDQTHFSGPHWGHVMKQPGFGDIYEVQLRSPMTDLNGHAFLKPEQANHFTRLKILRQWGGIFLSNETFVIRSLSEWLHYEMTLAADSNLMIIAHRDARLLKRWIDSYQEYDPYGPHRNGEIPPLLMHDELAVVLPLNLSGTVKMNDPTADQFKKRFVVKLTESRTKREYESAIVETIQAAYRGESINYNA